MAELVLNLDVQTKLQEELDRVVGDNNRGLTDAHLIRSHAQKYFLKAQKSGLIAHVPPPRPKCKAAHPYPRKAPKNADNGSEGVIGIGNSRFCGTGSSSTFWSTCNVPRQGEEGSLLHGTPDIPKIYRFIGSIFDPDSEGHAKKLKEMDPINIETVLLLMRNLNINLSTLILNQVNQLGGFYHHMMSIPKSSEMLQTAVTNVRNENHDQPS